MTTPDPAEKFVGIQISPISFIDEGVETVLDTLQAPRRRQRPDARHRVAGSGSRPGARSATRSTAGPTTACPSPYQMKGGAYFDPDPRYYRDTFMDDYRSRDPEFEGKDILEMVIPAAHARGMKVYIELMEPFFKYAGHGSADAGRHPNLAQAMEVDIFGRLGSEPSTANPGYRSWIHSMIEDQVRNYDLDGVMWCNERNSPLDTLIQGGAPATSRRTRGARPRSAASTSRPAGRRSCASTTFMQEAAAGKAFVDGTLITFLRALLDQPGSAGLGEVLARAQQGPRPRALRPREVVQAGPALRAQRLEPQPLQPASAGRSGRGPSRRATPTSSSRSPTSTRPARSGPRSWASSARPSCATSSRARPRPRSSASSASTRRPSPEIVRQGMDPDTYVLRPVRRRGAGRRRQGQGLHGHRRGRPAHPARDRRR